MLSHIYNFLVDKKPSNEAEIVPITTAVVAPQKSANSQGISFKPALVNELKNDHIRLVTLFGQMWDDCFAKGDYEKLGQVLESFKYEFQTHILKENVNFYAYLEQTLTGDNHSLAVIREFRRDMNDIANTVIKFCRKYKSEFFSSELKKEFQKDYSAIGEALTKRVTLEERDLYPMYQPR